MRGAFVLSSHFFVDSTKKKATCTKGQRTLANTVEKVKCSIPVFKPSWKSRLLRSRYRHGCHRVRRRGMDAVAAVVTITGEGRKT